MPESTLVVIDFETYWDSKTYTLSKMGPIEYVRNEKFTPQLCAFTLSNGSCCVDCSVVEHERLRTTFENLDTHDVAWCGHNMHGFDSLILSEFFDFHPQKIYDTIAMMRWTGLSRVCRESHAALTEFLGNGNKAAGTVVSDHKQWPDDFTPEERAFFIQYCKDDAGQCYQNAQDMLPYMTPDALRFMSITARMATEPSFVLDEDLLLEYLSDLDNAADKARQELMSMFSFKTNADMLAALRSADKFASMLRSLGIEPPLKESAAKTKTKREKLQLAANAGVPGAAEELENMQPVMTYAFSKTDVDFVLMQDHPDPRVALLVRTRLQLNSSIDRSRAETLLKFARMHKPLPIMLGAWLAHTGRYSAGASADAGTKTDKLQFQNLSKRDPSKRKLRQAIKVPKGKVVVACDSSQIEARGLAFVSNEVGLLTQFREGRDPYSELAETIFGVPWQDIKAGAKAGDKTMKRYRTVGKTAILSCLAGKVEVLTDTGWKRIDTVSINDKVWDGESWVNHEGLICNGWRNTINVAGVEMTPDHLLFDGFSWKMASDLIKDPLSMKSATAWAHASYETVPTTQQPAMCGTLQNVPSVVSSIGISLLHWYSKLRQIVASIAVNAYQKKLHDSSCASMKTLLLGQSLANLQSWAMSAKSTLQTKVLGGAIIIPWYNAPVVRNLTGYYKPTCVWDVLHVARNAHVKKHVRRKKKTIGTMLQLSPILIRDGGCYTASMLAFSDARRSAPQVVPGGNITVAEESEWSSRTACLSLSILSHCRDMMTRLWNWTASIATETTHRVIFALYPVKKTCITEEALHLCNHALTTSNGTSLLSNGVSTPCNTNYQKVYDLKNCGPNNRFLIRQGTTMLMAHNCGYSVGHTKYSNTLLRQGIHLHEDLDRHHELARYAHGIYRAAHPNIVAFWKTAENVLEAMLRGESGTFGGPNNDIYTFGIMPVGPRTDLCVPSVRFPSGYILRYPGLRAERNDWGKWQFLYDTYKGASKIPTHIYGGSFTNNLVQGLSFVDVIMYQGCRMDEAGIKLACNIHDAWASVMPEEQGDYVKQQMLHYMSMVPPALNGLPVACEAKIGTTFEIV